MNVIAEFTIIPIGVRAKPEDAQ